jgi:hypothetical protein
MSPPWKNLVQHAARVAPARPVTAFADIVLRVSAGGRERPDRECESRKQSETRH